MYFPVMFSVLSKQCVFVVRNAATLFDSVQVFTRISLKIKSGIEIRHGHYRYASNGFYHLTCL